MQHCISLLVFEERCRFEEARAVLVYEVSRGECHVILNVNSEPTGTSRLFVKLWSQEVTKFLAGIEARSIPFARDFWGYEVFRIDGQSGNQFKVLVEA